MAAGGVLVLELFIHVSNVCENLLGCACVICGSCVCMCYTPVKTLKTSYMLRFN